MATTVSDKPTIEEMKNFVRQHFEDFVNRRKLEVADVNLTPDFLDHGSDVPPGTPPGPQGAKQYVGSALDRFPDMHVTIDDIVAEGDKVVVRNTWTGTDRHTGKRLRFSGIVIWRLRDGKLAERWAFLQAPQPA